MHTLGDPGVLSTAHVPVPRPGQGQVLVRVHAAPISLQDLSIRSGENRAALPLVPGSDAAGDVVLVGPGVTEWSRGDRVIVVGDPPGRPQPGAYADYLSASAADLALIPDNVSFLSSASVVRTFSTAWSALLQDGRLGMNERVVVVGAADPIGIAVVQICRWKGSKVIAVSNGRHAPRLGALGATRVISESAPDLSAHVATALEERGATVVINLTGSQLPASAEMLDQNGRLVLTKGDTPQLLDVQLLVDRQAQVIGSAARIDTADVNHILKLLSEATFLPVIDSIYPLSQAVDAHRRAASEQTFGAVILVPDHLHRSDEEITQLRKES
jgi:NADPH2:quinone reductase